MHDPVMCNVSTTAFKLFCWKIVGVEKLLRVLGIGELGLSNTSEPTDL